MNNAFDEIQQSAKALKIDIYATDVANFIKDKEYDTRQLAAIAEILKHLRDRNQPSFLASEINVSTKGKNGCMHYAKRGKHNCIGVHCCIIT